MIFLSKIISIPTAKLLETSHSNTKWMDITELLESFIQQNKLKNGHLIISVKHSTAGFIYQENEEGLVAYDIPALLAKLVPEEGNYKHDRPERLKILRGEPKNAPSHLRAVIGALPNISIPIEEGKIDLGTWPRILFFDFDPKSHENRFIKCHFMGKQKSIGSKIFSFFWRKRK